MKNAFLILIALFFSSMIVASSVSGAECKIVYGGGPVCQGKLSVTKNVQAPGKGGEYVHSLTINDGHYGTNQTVAFQIIVQNQGQNSLSGVQVVDTLPQYLTFDSGNGSYNAKTNTVTITSASLAAGQSQTYYVVAKTAASSALPKNQSVVCVTNKVTAQSGSTSAQDSSSVCIDRSGQTAGTTITTPQVFGTPSTHQTPATGPEDFALPLLGMTGTVGYFLKKKSKFRK